MLARLDSFLIEKLDDFVTARQKRGLHLLALKVWWSFALLVAAIAQIWVARDLGMVYVGLMLPLTILVFGAGLKTRVEEFRIHQNYPEEHRRVLRLNAIVLLHREERAVGRIAYAVICLALMFPDVLMVFVSGYARYGVFFTFLLVSVLLESLMYLDCCKYIGPGEHSREKSESFAGALERSGT